jgi:outer membrane cobalamin receptor
MSAVASHLEGSMRFITVTLASAMLLALAASATIFGSIRGIVHDPQHRPISGASAILKATSSDWTKSGTTDGNGLFEFNGVPLGRYSVTVTSPGFADVSQNVVVNSGTQPILHIPLKVALNSQTVNVHAESEIVPTDSATPTTLVSRADIAQTPGADRSNSLAMITDYVPGAYLTHDQLHVRGGHQVSWLIDGVPVPNTNIASNLGPQFDPSDIDYLEAQRGSYSAQYGDRTYGVFNIVPRTGFERNNDAELVASFGNFYQTNDHLSFGSHTERFAYYGSINGNRSNLGIETPVPEVIHDAENGYGGFGSIILNNDPSNQLRVVTSLRKDYYRVPYDPNLGDLENRQYNSSGLRDSNRESDAIVNVSWVHTFSSKALVTVSPLFHYNNSSYSGAANDTPSATTDNHGSTYAGGQIAFAADVARNSLQAGFYSFYQRDNQNFSVFFNDNSGNANFTDREPASGNLQAFFLDDKFEVTSWLTLSAGIRPTRFSGGVAETAISPRLGAALVVPHLHWVFRGFYGHYYQAPPLATVSGPLLEFANNQNLAFITLHGERDEEHQFGVTIPFRGWTIDADTFRTNATNFFDHNNVGESNIFFPITISREVVRGWEATLHSPQIAHRGQIHLVYSNQIAEGALPITGGLTNFAPPSPLFLLDHDQRNTLNVGGNLTLPWSSFASTNVYYGSGFTDAGGPAHLPQHTTFDLSLGKDFGKRYSVSVNGLNVTNRHLLLDNSLTFGGFHWNNPREIYMEIRYRFHY